MSDGDEDPIKVGDEEEAPAWVPFREVVYRWGRNQRARRVSPMDETNRVLPRLPDARLFFCAAES